MVPFSKKLHCAILQCHFQEIRFITPPLFTERKLDSLIFYICFICCFHSFFCALIRKQSWNYKRFLFTTQLKADVFNLCSQPLWIIEYYCYSHFRICWKWESNTAAKWATLTDLHLSWHLRSSSGYNIWHILKN